jgi:uncharacterized MAPEG superfamily protein
MTKNDTDKVQAKSELRAVKEAFTRAEEDCRNAISDFAAAASRAQDAPALRYETSLAYVAAVNGYIGKDAEWHEV